jgi:hypothetical protein
MFSNRSLSGSDFADSRWGRTDEFREPSNPHKFRFPNRSDSSSGDVTPRTDGNIDEEPSLADRLIIPGIVFGVVGLMYCFLLRDRGLDGLAKIILYVEGRRPSFD